MSYWSGRYEDTKEAKDGLEGDILRAMEGKSTMETSSGGTIRVSPDKYDIYTPNSSAPSGHDHKFHLYLCYNHHGHGRLEH